VVYLTARSLFCVIPQWVRPWLSSGSGTRNGRSGFCLQIQMNTGSMRTQDWPSDPKNARRCKRISWGT
jgi:hypothetical protein